MSASLPERAERSLDELARLAADARRGRAPAASEVERALHAGSVALVEIETAMLADGERSDPLAGLAERLGAAMTDLQELTRAGGERPPWEQYGFVLPRRPPARDPGSPGSPDAPRRGGRE